MRIEVRGHSGCDIQISRGDENDDLRVIKSTANPDYAERLCRQARKQMAFHGFDADRIRVPGILGITQDANSASIQMEYVYSSNFIDFLEKTGIDRIDAFIVTLTGFIDDCVEQCEIHDVDTCVFYDKVDDVLNKIRQNEKLRDDLDIAAILRNAEESLRMSRKITIPVGICHGDLTLSNMLFNGDMVSLIDFLDSFIESPIVDIAKVRQDTRFGWSLLMYDGAYDALRMKMVLEYIDDKVSAHYRSFTWYDENYRAFEILNLLRVLQYAKEYRTINFLKGALRSSIDG